MTDQEILGAAMAYTDNALEGAGALKGAPCKIKSITSITGGHRVTFEWEDNEGETSTETMDVMDGTNGTDGDDGVGISSITYKEEDQDGNYVYTVLLTNSSSYDITCPKGPQGETGATGADGQDGTDGNGIVSIVKTSTSGLVDTYTITYTDGTTSTFTVTNGAGTNEFIGTLAEWNNLTSAEKKAFDTYQITDDYSEALMPNYSTTEQKTGQKWIDGKDIYFRTFTGLSIQSNTSWINTDIDISYVETIVDGVALDNAGQVITNSFGGTSGGVLLLRSLFIGNTISTVTLYYTKKA